MFITNFSLIFFVNLNTGKAGITLITAFFVTLGSRLFLVATTWRPPDPQTIYSLFADGPECFAARTHSAEQVCLIFKCLFTLELVADPAASDFFEGRKSRHQSQNPKQIMIPKSAKQTVEATVLTAAPALPAPLRDSC